MSSRATQEGNGAAAAVEAKSLSREESLTQMLRSSSVASSRREMWERSLVAFRLLSVRCFQELTRHRTALAIKYAANVFFALLFGFVYFQVRVRVGAGVSHDLAAPHPHQCIASPPGRLITPTLVLAPIRWTGRRRRCRTERGFSSSRP